MKKYYDTYIKSRAREEIRRRKLDELDQPEGSSSTVQSSKPSCSRPKRHKIVANIPPWEKNCVICNHMTSKRDSSRYRLSKPKSAKHFQSAYNFNKDAVHTRRILYQTVKDHFATD